MNCEQIKRELELYLGFEEIPDELAAHLTECEDCRAYWTELDAAAGFMGQDDDFYPSDAAIERAVRAVDDRIAARSQVTKITQLRWVSRVSSVAAAVLLLFVSWSTVQFGGVSTLATLNDEQRDSLIERAYPEDIVAEVDASETEYTLDDASVAALIEDYTDRYTYRGGEYLLDDLSDEEFEYLSESFDVGELL